MTVVKFCRYRALTYLESESGTAPPVELCREIEKVLQYDHVEFLRGADAYDPNTNRSTRIRTEKRNLYTYISNRRPIFQRGFERRVWDVALRLGITPKFVNTNPPHPEPERLEFKPERVFERLQLKARQDECLAAIADNEYGQIWAPTGFGKGFIIVAVALAYPKAKIVVITGRTDVAATLEQRLADHIPSVGRIGGGKEVWGRVTVVNADSMHKIPHEVHNEPDIVLYDESHEAPTPTRLRQLNQFVSSRMYGLSASANCRMDGADFRLEGFFGPPIFEMTFAEAEALGLVLKIKTTMIGVHASSNPYREMKDVVKERHAVWRNEHRNSIIASIASSFGDDEQVLVMVRSVDHAAHLKKFLPGFQMCYDTVSPERYRQFVNAGLIDPEVDPIMTKQRRRDMTKQFEAGTLRKVICTDVWSTGVSFDQLGVLIRADARSSKGISIQAPGRTCRRSDATGKQEGWVIDFQDNFDTGLNRRARDREKVYEGMEWQITRMTPEEFLATRQNAAPRSVGMPT